MTANSLCTGTEKTPQRIRHLTTERFPSRQFPFAVSGTWLCNLVFTASNNFFIPHNAPGYRRYTRSAERVRNPASRAHHGTTKTRVSLRFLIRSVVFVCDSFRLDFHHRLSQKI